MARAVMWVISKRRRECQCEKKRSSRKFWGTKIAEGLLGEEARLVLKKKKSSYLKKKRPTPTERARTNVRERKYEPGLEKNYVGGRESIKGASKYGMRVTRDEKSSYTVTTGGGGEKGVKTNEHSAQARNGGR